MDVEVKIVDSPTEYLNIRTAHATHTLMEYTDATSAHLPEPYTKTNYTQVKRHRVLKSTPLRPGRPGSERKSLLTSMRGDAFVQ